MESVLFEKKGPVGWFTLNRPEERNALSLELMEEMQEKLNCVSKDRDVRVVVIKGNGPAFCAGHNLREMTEDDCDIRHFRKIFSVCSDMMQTLHKLPQPVIAQVHGIATAAGCQIVAACDLAIAETGAQFATPGVKIGLFCSTPMVPLSRVIGRRRALDMLLSGRFISAEEAEKFGLVNKVTDPDKLAEETEKWAMEFAQYSLFTLEFGKKAFYTQADWDEPSAYNYAKEAIAINCLAEDAQEGMKAFVEKREPEWKDR
ncbi:enoyl-CoA hydratase [Desulfonema magnum]|uniref:Enoyl-CoA hydratase domain-containing protein 3, mitochondrial n=1 Tax=Desulfonema magnum TaxID=45655 RepID=A0A975BUI2_9BACT|nr:enoyl-CoA hydratase [Desulfonema magnum]QTA91883.1 Enoyl-CoA hydratase/isomerase [Desulfonema magnum]